MQIETNDEIPTPPPSSVGTALARAKELRDAGNGHEADALLESFFARATAEKQAAEEAKKIAEENLRRAVQKKERHARTHEPKLLPPPQDEPLWEKIKNKPLNEKLVAIGRFTISECGADFGPPPDGFRGVPQRGSFGPPEVHIAAMLEKHGVDETAKRLSMKVDELMLTAREYALRGHRLAVLACLRVLNNHVDDDDHTYDFDAITAYDPAASKPNFADDYNAAFASPQEEANDGADDDDGAHVNGASAIDAEVSA